MYEEFILKRYIYIYLYIHEIILLDIAGTFFLESSLHAAILSSLH
jgi:hypothetical protein